MIAPEHSNIVQMWGGEGRGGGKKRERDREKESNTAREWEKGREKRSDRVGQRNERKKERLRENTK